MNIFETLFSRRTLVGQDWAKDVGEELTDERLDLLADLKDLAEKYPYLGREFVRDFLGGSVLDINDVCLFVLARGLGHISSYEWSKMGLEAIIMLVSFLSGFRDGGVVQAIGGEYKLRQAKEACKKDAYRLTDAVLADGSHDLSADVTQQFVLLRLLCENR